MESQNFEGYKKKLESLCDEHGLVYSFRYDTYPAALTIQPAGDMDSQVTMLEYAGEKPVNSPDAKLVLEIRNGLVEMSTCERLYMTDALYKKFVNLFKKLHYSYLQMLHEELVKAGSIQKLPFPAPSQEQKPEKPEVFDGELDEADGEPPDADDEDGGDFPDDLMDYGDDEDDIPRMSFEDYLLKAGTEAVRANGWVDMDFLMKKFNISFSKAAQLIEALEDAGVIGDERDEKGRRMAIIIREEAAE